MSRFCILAIGVLFFGLAPAFADDIVSSDGDEAPTAPATKSITIELGSVPKDLQLTALGQSMKPRLIDWQNRYIKILGDTREFSGHCDVPGVQKINKWASDTLQTWEWNGDQIQTDVDEIATAKYISSQIRRSFSKECQKQALKAENQIVQMKTDAQAAADKICK